MASMPSLSQKGTPKMLEPVGCFVSVFFFFSKKNKNLFSPYWRLIVLVEEKMYKTFRQIET